MNGAGLKYSDNLFLKKVLDIITSNAIINIVKGKEVITMEKLIEAKYNLKVVNYAMLQKNRDKLDIEEPLLATRIIAMELGALLNRFTFWDDVTELLKGDKNLDAMREMWEAKVQEAKEQLYGE